MQEKANQSSRVSILEIKVQDNGAGISSEQLHKIFDRFYQADTSHTREQEGSGIGLALVRELVDLHGGEVVAEAQPGEGACFTIRLPLSVADFEELEIVEHTVERDEQSITPLNDAGYEGPPGIRVRNRKCFFDSDRGGQLRHTAFHT